MFQILKHIEFDMIEEVVTLKLNKDNPKTSSTPLAQ